MNALSHMPKIGYRAPQAAEYMGISLTKFYKLVEEKRIPAGRRIDGCVIWRGDELYDAFLRLLDAPAPGQSGQTLDQKLGLA